MIGYKIAVGIDRKNGPFPVLVKLEVPEDATIVRPFDGIKLEILNRCFFSERTLHQLRTDKAKVLEINPVSTWENYLEDWNGKAYSVYSLSRDINMNISGHVFCYEEGKEVSSYLDLDERYSCVPGIHLFESNADAVEYLLFDDYFMNCINKFSKVWTYKTNWNDPWDDEDYQQYANSCKNHLIDLSK
jgi:hypothetical protein